MRSLKEQQLSAAAAELQVQSLELELESGETRALQPAPSINIQFYSNLKISDFLLGVLKVVGAQISKSVHINVQSISLT